MTTDQPATPESEGPFGEPVAPSREESRQMSPSEVNRFLAARGLSVRVRDDGGPAPTLDAAWQRAERALAAAAIGSRFESTELTVVRQLRDRDEPVAYTAMAERIEFREPESGPANTKSWEADGPSAAAALNALASKLEGED